MSHPSLGKASSNLPLCCCHPPQCDPSCITMKATTDSSHKKAVMVDTVLELGAPEETFGHRQTLTFRRLKTGGGGGGGGEGSWGGRSSFQFFDSKTRLP